MFSDDEVNWWSKSGSPSTKERLIHTQMCNKSYFAILEESFFLKLDIYFLSCIMYMYIVTLFIIVSTSFTSSSVFIFYVRRLFDKQTIVCIYKKNILYLTKFLMQTIIHGFLWHVYHFMMLHVIKSMYK